MISSAEFTKQCKRLLRLPFPPASDEDVKGTKSEWYRVLARCPSDAHMVAVVDYIVDSSQRCPPPAELARALAKASGEYRGPAIWDHAAGKWIPLTAELAAHPGVV